MISAKIIACSITPWGKWIITWELEYPRFIHGEFMTHRMFSRNAASSRAIPVAAVIEQVRNNPAMPIHWGKNQAGMQAEKELSSVLQTSAKYLWKRAAKFAAKVAEGLSKIGLHKQATNRILEPFQLMKVVMTTTEDDNWFWLRYHADAQPEIRELARLMWEAKQEAEPFLLQPGEWHVPYVARHRQIDGTLEYWSGNQELSLEEALAVSSSCCAQVSYRKLDDSLEKAELVYERLVGSEPVHASPFEHQATPIDDVEVEYDYNTWPEGITHVDRDGKFWSGNFQGWIQHRQLIPNNVCKKYVPQGAEE